MEMSDKKYLSIYFDTNALEIRNSENISNISEFKLHNDFYAIRNFIDKYNLKDYIKLCIPQVVFDEMKAHYINAYKSYVNSIKDKIQDYKSKFGTMLEIDYNIKCENEYEYKNYIEDAINHHVYKKDYEIIAYPSDCLTKLITKALITESPFSIATGKNQKRYSDAGFKDAIVLETLLSKNDFKREKVILFSKDKGFDDIKIDSLNIFNKREDIEDFILTFFEIDNEKDIIKKINDSYFINRILENIGENYNDSINSTIENLELEKDSSDLYNVKQIIVINEVKYCFNYTYDFIANDFLNLQYFLEND